MNPQLEQKILNCKLCQSLGINFEKEREENLRYAYQYKPEKVKILWIVESPPKSVPARYFYRPELTRFDSLFRETMKALNIPISNPKSAALKEFQSRGNFLIDSMKCPADKSNAHLKPQMRINCSSILNEEILSLDPENILIIKADVYYPVINQLIEIDRLNPEKNISVRVLNKNSIPFPGSGQQIRFREAVKQYLKFNNGY